MKDKLIKARREINGIDKKMAKLFCKRMEAATEIAGYKHEHGLDVFDAKREAELIEKNSSLVPAEHKDSYTQFLRKLISLSKEKQSELVEELKSTGGESAPAVLRMHLCENSYPIIIGGGLLCSVDKHFNLKRKVFIVTDDGVPAEYAETVKNLCGCATVYTVKSGEESKSFAELMSMLSAMSEFSLSRSDCVVAVGGGVVGDLAGFAASIYMRGIDFYNVPTTLLAQVDSSIGGKNGINLRGVKNSIGSFKQPKAVIVDVDTLSTLPIRHMRNGMCEVIKMAAIKNEELFRLLEGFSESDAYDSITTIITEALKIKRSVVEADEKEAGLRKILNFGHTLGHAIETSVDLGDLLHGECVSLGMIPVSLGEARERISSVLTKFHLPTSRDLNAEKFASRIMHDKKTENGKISIVFCQEIGKCHIKSMTIDEFIAII